MNVKLMIIGESPSNTRPEGMEDILFSGRTSQILWRNLKEFNLSREDFYITNVFDTAPDKSKKVIVPEECKKRLLHEISAKNPILIMTVGKIATEALLGPISFMENVAHPRLLENLDVWILPTVHPAAVARNPSLENLLHQCCQYAGTVRDVICKI